MADSPRKIVGKYQASTSTARVARGQDEMETQAGSVNKRVRLSASRTLPHWALTPPQMDQYSRLQLRANSTLTDILQEDVGPDLDLGSKVSEVEEDKGSEENESEEEDNGSEEDEAEEEDDNGSEEDEAEGENNGTEENGGAEAVSNASRAITLMLTDSDLLNCLICVKPLRSPIYQCENGHVICSLCHVKVVDQSSCCLPTVFTRSLGMERLLESMRVECENKSYGCPATMMYRRKACHEQICPHKPCFCPFSYCHFCGSSKQLIDHHRTKHQSYTKEFTYGTTFTLIVKTYQMNQVFVERNEGVIFVLNHVSRDNLASASEQQGSVFNVCCIGPDTLKGAFVYKLRARCNKTYLSLDSEPEVCLKWQHQKPMKNYLMTPSDFLEDCRFYIEICIKKAEAEG